MTSSAEGKNLKGKGPLQEDRKGRKVLLGEERKRFELGKGELSDARRSEELEYGFALG